MHPLRKLFEQTAIYGLSSIVVRFLNYLLVPLHTYIFSPAEYGVVTELYAYIGFLLIVLTYGMETAFFRFSSRHSNFNKIYGTAITALACTSSLFIILVLFFNRNIAGWLHYSSHNEYIIWFGIIVGLDAFTAIPFAKLRHQNKAKRFAFVKFINIAVNISINLFFLYLCPYLLKQNSASFVQHIYNPDIGIGYIFIANLSASIVTLLLLSFDIFEIKLCFDKKILKSMLRYSMPLLIAGLAGMINETLDRILLKHFIVVPDGITNEHEYIMRQIGIYGANYKLAVLMTLFIQTFRYAFEPFFFSQSKNKNAKKLYSDIMTYFVIFGLMIFLGINFYLDIIKYFIGTKFHEGLHIAPILLMANLFLGIYVNFSVWYKLNDLTIYGAVLSITGAVITIVANIILIPKIGYTGSAWATFICYFCIMLISFFLGRKHYPVPYKIRKIGLYFGIALAFFFVSRYIVINSQILLYVINTILLIIFVAIAFFKEKPLQYFTSKRNKL